MGEHESAASPSDIISMRNLLRNMPISNHDVILASVIESEEKFLKSDRNKARNPGFGSISKNVTSD